MDYKKAVLGAASVLALTAGIQQSADASLPRTDKPVVAITAARVLASINVDPLFDLIKRTKGSLTGESIENALTKMFGIPSREQIEGFPNLLAGIVNLGVTSETAERSKNLLVAIVDSASTIDENLRVLVINQLEAGDAPIVLAESRRCLQDPRAAGCSRDPDVVGQVGGGYR